MLDKTRYYVHRFRSHNSDSDTSIRIFSSLSIKSDHAFHTFLKRYGPDHSKSGSEPAILCKNSSCCSNLGYNLTRHSSATWPPPARGRCRLAAAAAGIVQTAATLYLLCIYYLLYLLCIYSVFTVSTACSQVAGVNWADPGPAS